MKKSLLSTRAFLLLPPHKELSGPLKADSERDQEAGSQGKADLGREICLFLLKGRPGLPLATHPRFACVENVME